MKKNFTFLLILTLNVADLWPQATPNAGFENWTHNSFPSYDTPDNWDNANPQSAIAGVFGCIKATASADIHSGSAAVKLITKSILGNTAPGVVTTGTLPTSVSDPISGGIPYTLRPDSIAGWYKYTPQGSDNGFAEFMLFGSAANNTDTIAKARFATPTTAVGTYTRFSAPLVYNSSNAVANSIWLISSSNNSSTAVIGSMIIVDDIELIINPAIPVMLSITSQTNVLCNGGCTGSATATASSGTSPYSYLWSNSQTTATATGLCAGTHTVTVTDAASQSATATVTITEPAVLTGTISSINVSCYGGNNGTANITVTGGIPSYTYIWSNGQGGASATGLSVGTYTVTFTDANSCTSTLSATISQPSSAIVITVNATNATCGSNNGSATASANGGTGGLMYLWSTGATIQTITGLAAGAYGISVTDDNGCVSTATASVSNDGAPVATISNQTDVYCYGGSNGSATVTATGGFTPYTYLWSNGQSAATATGLTAGNYSVSVSDTSGCYGVAAAIITGPAALTVTVTSTTDNGSSNGTASAYPPGGTVPPYTYSWSAGGQATATITGLAAGNYSVTVTDGNGCISFGSVTVNSSVGFSFTSNLKSPFTVYPNPADETVIIDGGNLSNGNYEVNIYSILGQILFNEKFYHNGGILQKEINLEEIKEGFVLVEIISEKSSILLLLLKTP